MKLKDFKEKLRWKGLKSIEFRILWWMMRAAGVFAVIAYLALNIMGAWTWVQVKRVRMQDLAQLKDVVAEAEAKKDLSGAERWVLYRPAEESAQLLELVPPLTGMMSPSIFFNLSDRALYLNDEDTALKWNVVGRFRLRYDLLRCGMADTAEIGDKLLTAFASAGQSRIAVPDTATQVRLARAALDFDAQYPAVNDPEAICTLLHKLKQMDYAMVDRGKWSELRFSLRRGTDASLADEEKRLKEGGK